MSLGADGELMLLDAPGVLPMRCAPAQSPLPRTNAQKPLPFPSPCASLPMSTSLTSPSPRFRVRSLADQDAAIRLAICNDIGEASYTTSLVAADFVDQIRQHEGGSVGGLISFDCCQLGVSRPTAACATWNRCCGLGGARAFCGSVDSSSPRASDARGRRRLTAGLPPPPPKNAHSFAPSSDPPQTARRRPASSRSGTRSRSRGSRGRISSRRSHRRRACGREREDTELHACLPPGFVTNHSLGLGQSAARCWTHVTFNLPCVPPQTCAGDSERAGRKILKDYQNGYLGAFCLEQPPRSGDEGPGSKDYRLTRVALNVNK